MIQVPFTGGCQCEAVRYRGSMPPFVAYTCHCRACQKMTSSAFAICMHIPAESLEVTQGSPVTQQRTADDGNILTTHFCGDCGSPLFIANNARPGSGRSLSVRWTIRMRLKLLPISGLRADCPGSSCRPGSRFSMKARIGDRITRPIRHALKGPESTRFAP